ncbi:MAG: hypothetical protein JW891_18155 [Candidatus Lokiarchaeota archaeon]|nr:hypothetical protein [Candidatus Lokiarchaeota archaeon]
MPRTPPWKCPSPPGSLLRMFPTSLGSNTCPLTSCERKRTRSWTLQRGRFTRFFPILPEERTGSTRSFRSKKRSRKRRFSSRALVPLT